MTFEKYWQRKLQANPNLKKDTNVFSMKVSAFRTLLESAYNAGAKDTALVAKELADARKPHTPPIDIPDFMQDIFNL
jgi:hypothetical protein